MLDRILRLPGLQHRLQKLPGALQEWQVRTGELFAGNGQGWALATVMGVQAQA